MTHDTKNTSFKTATQELRHMLVRNPLLLLGVGGLLGAILFSFIFGTKPDIPHNELALPPSSPYVDNVSGIGIVEANSKNIQVGAFLSGIVDKVFVMEGAIVKKGDPLFTLDTRAAEAEVQLRKVKLAMAQDQFDRVQGMKSGMAISTEDKANRGFALAEAKAALRVAQVVLDKSTVYAPISGLIMKVYIKEGERVSEQSHTAGVLLMGNNNPLFVRVQIDENDMWRFKANTPATAFLKSHKEHKYPLKFVRTEPYALPKSQLSGDLNERVDTRIVEVLYQIEGDTSDLYIGQQLDVFIETAQNEKKIQDAPVQHTS